MRLFNSYNKFTEHKSINENVAKAKKFLKDRYIIRKAAEGLRLFNVNDSNDDLGYAIKSGEINTLKMSHFPLEKQKLLRDKIKEIKPSQEEIKKIENDEDYKKIREMLKGNDGYTFMFVYFFFVDNVPHDELKELYQRVLNNRDLIQRFGDMLETNKRKFDVNFIDERLPSEADHRKNVEVLVDGLDGLDKYRYAKRIIDELPTKLKNEAKKAPPKIQEQLADLSRAFDNIPNGDKLTDVKDPVTGELITKKVNIWRNFFGNMGKDTRPLDRDGSPNKTYGKLVYRSRLRSYENLGLIELIRAMRSYIDNAAGDDVYLAKLNKIDEVDQKYGAQGVDIVFSENKVIVVDVKSFQANRELNSETSHCIVTNYGLWNHYIGDFNKQYYIYNLNVSSGNQRIIGVTIDEYGNIYAAHDATDGDVGRSLKDILKGWEDKYNIKSSIFDSLRPMKGEEVEARKRAKEAERHIGDANLSLETLRRYVIEDGADINKDNAKALINAVIEDDMEKIKFCIEYGANPNLAKEEQAAISKTDNLEVIRILIENGAEMTNKVFINIMDDNDALTYCLEAGMDPNLNKSMPFRKACVGTFNKKTKELGHSYFQTFKLLLEFGAEIADPDTGRDTIIKYAAEYARMEILEYLFREKYDQISDRNIIDAIGWMIFAKKITDDQKDEAIAYLKSKVRGKVGVKVGNGSRYYLIEDE